MAIIGRRPTLFKGNTSHVLHAWCHVWDTLGPKIVNIYLLKLITFCNPLKSRCDSQLLSRSFTVGRLYCVCSCACACGRRFYYQKHCCTWWNSVLILLTCYRVQLQRTLSIKKILTVTLFGCVFQMSIGVAPTIVIFQLQFSSAMHEMDLIKFWKTSMLPVNFWYFCHVSTWNCFQIIQTWSTRLQLPLVQGKMVQGGAKTMPFSSTLNATKIFHVETAVDILFSRKIILFSCSISH
jgi:hypothetical protein